VEERDVEERRVIFDATVLEENEIEEVAALPFGIDAPNHVDHVGHSLPRRRDEDDTIDCRRSPPAYLPERNGLTEDRGGPQVPTDLWFRTEIDLKEVTTAGACTAIDGHEAVGSKWEGFGYVPSEVDVDDWRQASDSL
jgi:hypothetical protein